MIEGVRRQNQVTIYGRGKRFASEIVSCRSQAAGRDDDVGPLDRALKDVNARLQLVAHGGVIQNTDAQLAKSLAEPLRVGIEELPAGDFVANGEDLSVHRRQCGKDFSRAGGTSIAGPVELLESVGN